MATILDGKKLSEKILEDLRIKIKKSGKKLKLAAILVGEDKDSKIFLRQKERACQKVGIDFQLFKFSASIGQEVLEKEVGKIARQENQGIIIQLPLPGHIKTQEVLNLIPAEKDVDALSGKILPEKILAPVLGGVLELFKEYEINIKGKNVVVVGRGLLVGKPVSEWMKKNGVRVSVIDKKTRNISEITKKADILISGVGKQKLIKGDMIKEGTAVVDVAGDVDFKTVEPRASYIAPIPGGVGPMTVVTVIKNLIILNKK